MQSPSNPNGQQQPAQPQPFNLSQPPPRRRNPPPTQHLQQPNQYQNRNQNHNHNQQQQQQQQHQQQLQQQGTDLALTADSIDAPLDTSDAIREGKQRAKSVMAASGIDVPFSSSSAATSTPPPPPVNGAPMSRKRSRSGSRLPARTPSTAGPSTVPQPTHDEILLERYVQLDSLHAAAMNDQAERTRQLVRSKEQGRDWCLREARAMRAQHPAALFGYGYAGYGNGRTDVQPASFYYPMHRKRIGNRRTRELHVLRKEAAQQAEYFEELVPLRLDIELEKLRLRDTFTWNLNDRLVSTQLFADTLVEDLRLPIESSQQIARQVHQDMLDQLNNYYPHVYPSGVPAEPDLPYGAHKNDDMRITVKLNITIGHITLVDQFEWDLNNPLNSPEEFARQMALDLSLSGEFTTAIAHSIREQCQLYTKSLFLTNYEFDGRLIEDPDVRDSMLPSPVYSAFRPHQAQKDWTPYMYELSEMELEKTELSMLREQRAQKRQLNRRGGPALPDLKERQRTVRSLVVSSVIPGAAETLEASGIIKIRRKGGRGPRPIRDDASDSDDLELEDSGPDSPAPSQLIGTGTARTRGIRGAATAAQAAMRMNYGRSTTPDVAVLPETRTSSRRATGGFDTREDTAEPTSLIVKLRINPERLKQFMAKRKYGRTAAPPLSGFPTSVALPQASQPATPQLPSKQAPSTPALQTKALPTSQRSSATPARQPPPPSRSGGTAGSSALQHGNAKKITKDVQHDEQGRVEVPVVPGPDDPTPVIPPWLERAISILHDRYPTSQFEGLMKFGAINAETGGSAPSSVWQHLPPGASPPDSYTSAETGGQKHAVKFAWLPRIRCLDCTAKVYTADPEGTVEKFEVHLKNRKHRGAVEERLASAGGSQRGKGKA